MSLVLLLFVYTLFFAFLSPVWICILSTAVKVFNSFSATRVSPVALLYHIHLLPGNSSSIFGQLLTCPLFLKFCHLKSARKWNHAVYICIWCFHLKLPGESSKLLSISILYFFLLLSRRQWHPTPVLLPGKSHGRRSLVGCSPWGLEETDATEQLPFHFSLSCIGEGNGNPLHCSCLENPRGGGAWWAAVYGVTQSRTRLKRLSSSSILLHTHTHQFV